MSRINFTLQVTSETKSVSGPGNNPPRINFSLVNTPAVVGSPSYRIYKIGDPPTSFASFPNVSGFSWSTGSMNSGVGDYQVEVQDANGIHVLATFTTRAEGGSCFWIDSGGFTAKGYTSTLFVQDTGITVTVDEFGTFTGGPDLSVQISLNGIYTKSGSPNGGPTHWVAQWTNAELTTLGLTDHITSVSVRRNNTACTEQTNTQVLVDGPPPPPVCNLAFGSPAFTKTNESVAGANDGTININATSTYTRSYSLDNVTYFLSNAFPGLAPGNYTIHVKDTNPAGCHISQAGVIIAAGSIPCDLAFSLPGATVVDSIPPEANNGSVTLHATTTHGPIQYSKVGSGGPFQLSNVFSGLANGTYTFYIKDANNCQSQMQVLVGPEPPIIVQINEQPINEGNFVVWFVANGPKNFNTITCTNENWDLAQGYRINKISSRRHTIVAVPNVKFNFYINLPVGFSDPNFDQWRIAIADNNGIVLDTIATLVKDSFGDGTHYNVYTDEIVIPAGSIPEQVYRLVIYNSTTNQVILMSNDIALVSIDEAKAYSNEIKYRASFNMYGYFYERIPASFINTIRVRLYKLEEQSDGELTQYRGASTGRLRNVSFELDRYIVLEAYYFNDSGHRAMQVFQAHDYILINNIAYLPKSLYKVDFNPSRTLNKGTLEMYEQAFSQANRYSSAPITVIGSDDPLLGNDDGGSIGI